MIRIGIDVRKYHDFGIGTYIQNIVAKVRQQQDLTAMLYASPSDTAEILRNVGGPVEPNSSPKYSLRELVSLSRAANQHRVDLFHAPHYTLPYGLRMPSVVTVHDIIHLKFKQYFTPLQRRYAETMIRHACTASNAVIVNSEFTKDELLSVIAIDPAKVHVVPMGVNPVFFTPVSQERRDAFAQRHKLDRPYILYTGSVKAHKNILTLLRAFNTLRRVYDVLLVFAGEKLETDRELFELTERMIIKQRIRDLGRLSLDDLATAYQGARAVVLPSFYEGFGFSMVEAMASGVPAIGSKAGSIPEVMGKAGLIFDPYDGRRLEEYLGLMMIDESLRQELIEKGRTRAQQFSWDRCAERTIDIYRKVVE